MKNDIIKKKSLRNYITSIYIYLQRIDSFEDT